MTGLVPATQVQPVMLDIVERAGSIALGYFGSQNPSWTKAGNSPVSQADIEVDTFLAKALLEAFPSHGWLSEESEDTGERLSHRQIFIADPIDGTRGFLAGDPHWCISLARLTDGRPDAAIVHCPALGRTWSAIAGKGATLNAEPILPERGKAIASLAGSRKINEAIEAFAPGKYAVAPYYPSLAYRLVLVASGEIDGAYARGGSHEWDIAAADLILEEAGSTLACVDGSRIDYNNKNIRAPALLAAGPGMLPELLDLAKRGRFLQ
ncbi:MAG: 3'(2'),5'-bisphosphate nucleotidase CysQ [Rhizobiaceae bacterium]